MFLAWFWLPLIMSLGISYSWESILMYLWNSCYWEVPEQVKVTCCTHYVHQSSWYFALSFCRSLWSSFLSFCDVGRIHHTLSCFLVKEKYLSSAMWMWSGMLLKARKRMQCSRGRSMRYIGSTFLAIVSCSPNSLT